MRSNVAVNVKVGEHIKWDIFGVSLHGDTIISTLVAGAIVIAARASGCAARSTPASRAMQLFFETVTEQVEQQVEDTMGIKTAPVRRAAGDGAVPVHPVRQLAVDPARPGDHAEYAPPPASDVNLTYALALLVIVHDARDRYPQEGPAGLLRTTCSRQAIALLPLNIIEELIKPVTLALRLFGNIFSGTIMVSLIALFPASSCGRPTSSGSCSTCSSGSSRRSSSPC